MTKTATWMLAATLLACLAGCRATGNGYRVGLLGTPLTVDVDGFPEFKKAKTFNPTCYPQGNWHPEGLDYQDVWFYSCDGTRLHGWYVPHEHPRAVILYCHGNSGNLSHRVDTLRSLHDEAGVSVFIFDYRGYGRSEGKPNEEGVLADARAARACLASLAGVDQQEIVLLGHALGTAIAVDLAARDGAKALVLESAFTSVPDVGASYFPRLPVRLMTRTDLNSLHKIGRYHGPLLQSHGDGDTIVPYQLGTRLYQAANGPKEFLTLPGHDHMDPLGDDYYQRLASFLDDAAPSAVDRMEVAETPPTPSTPPAPTLEAARPPRTTIRLRGRRPPEPAAPSASTSVSEPQGPFPGL